MSSQDAYDLSRTYGSEMVKGNVSQAYSIAMQGVHLYEKRDDLKQAAIWRRALSETLLMQGRYDEAAAEAETSAEMQRDVYERARSLIRLSVGLMFSAKYSAAFIALGKSEEIA